MAKYDKVDYSKSMIYKLCCKDVNIKEIYVGSTTNLIKRKYQHKADCYNKNRKVIIIMYINLSDQTEDLIILIWF